MVVHPLCCSFYIVTYALAIYMLNLLLGFLRWARLQPSLPAPGCRAARRSACSCRAARLGPHACRAAAAAARRHVAVARPAPTRSPQISPELEGPTLPTKGDEEFRPFVRRLPEFKFW